MCSYLSNLPSALAATVVGPYLSDSEAVKWAQCSKQSHSQLQQYMFAQVLTRSRMLDVLSKRSPTASFGRISHVRVETASEWIDLANLPPHVHKVTINIRDHELQLLYPPSDEEIQQSSQCCDRSHMLPRGWRTESLPSPEVCLPSTVTDLLIEGTAAPLLEIWLNHLRLPNNSRLRVVRLVLTYLVPNWTSLPAFVRHSLPDTVVELWLPLQFAKQYNFEDRHHQPSAEYYPNRWPPNLTILAIACTLNSPFAKGELPELPASLTDLRGMFFSDESRLQSIANRLPDSITSLDLNQAQNINGDWKLPSKLRCLRLPRLTQIGDVQAGAPGGPDGYRSAFKFPPNLQELNVSMFSNWKQLSILLPPTVTELHIGVHFSDNEDKQKPPFEGLQWPQQLRKLEFITPGGNVKGTLQHWTPPSHLTQLNLNYWDQPLEHVPLPATLRILLIGSCTHSLENVNFPPSLEILAFSLEFPSLSVGKWRPPPQLKSLSVRTIMEPDLLLPPSLTRLEIAGLNNAIKFNVFGECLPRGLLELKIGSLSQGVVNPLSALQFPPKLRHLTIDSRIPSAFDFAHLPTRFPDSLRELIAVTWTSKQFRELPRVNDQELAEWAAKSTPFECAFIHVKKEW